MREIITEIENMNDFKKLLISNRGIIIIKLSAEWCNPCKSITPFINSQIQKMIHNNIQIVDMDVDDNFEVFVFLKNKKMVHGIPAVLMYYKGNENYIPDKTVFGTNERDIAEFFNHALQRVN